MESNGWYVVGALSIVVRGDLARLAPALRAARSTAHAPSAAKVRDYEGVCARRANDGSRRQARAGGTRRARAQETRRPEELGELGLRRRGGGHSSGRGVDDRASPAAPKPKPKPGETARMIRSGGSATAIPSPRTRPGANRPDGGRAADEDGGVFEHGRSARSAGASAAPLDEIRIDATKHMSSCPRPSRDRARQSDATFLTSFDSGA